MSERLTAREIEAAVRALIEARPSTLGMHVTTPVIYPNGDFVEVITAPEAKGFVVHDAGVGGMLLAAEGFRISREIALRIKSAAERYDCVVSGGRIGRACERQDVGLSIALVANASRAVADFASEGRRQNESQFRYLVTEKIREIVGGRLRENENFKGKSGRGYRVQNVILDTQLSRPLAFAVPLASRSSVPNQFRELFDLKAAFPAIFNESIYNDAGDFRPDEDGWILEQVGGVIPLSELSSRLPALLDAQ